MKSRKTKAIVALGLAAVSGFLLMATGFAEETKVIKLDAKNAVQIIPRIIFRSTLSDTANEVDLINVGNLVRIKTESNNFVIYKQGNEPHVEGSYSAVLGGERNQIYGASDKSVIIAGEDNTVTNAAGGTIGGGKNNTVSSNYGTVAGGQQNTAKEYGTVVGGSQNVAGGGFSVALGSNSKANGNNSVAMGTNATVNGENSFLWSDGTATLNDSDIFAVVAESGMVVNDEKAHRFAKLTIGGSLLLNEGAKDNEVVCGGGRGEGVVRVVKNDDATDQICFCSCNGKSRQSLFGAGNCNEMCGANPAPQCGTSPKNLVKVCSEDSKKFVYSGTCDVGDVVEGDGAYFVDKDGEVHWTCQTNDGRWQDCHSTVKDVYPGNCEEPEEDGKCSGSYSSNGAQFLEGSNEGFNGIKDATLYPNRTAALGKKCAWFCPDGTEQYGEICRNKNGCPADMIEDYEYGYLDDGAQTGVVKVVAGQTCRNTVVCNDGIPSLLLPTDDCTTNSCIGNYPDGATLSTATPANNTTSWSCSTSTVQACTYTCPSGKVCDGTTGCRASSYGSCDLSEAYGCGDGNTVNKTDTTDSTEWERYCKGADDTGDGAYCHKGCPDGKHLKWNATHNGICVNDVKVKFKVNNNSSSSVVVSKVELGSTTVVEFKNNGGTVGQTVSSHNSVTSDYSTYNFVEGQSYSMKLGYNCVNNQTNCEYINETFTPYAGENLFTFNISDPDPEIYNYKIYWSYTVGSELITYNMKVKNLDTNRYENMPITVGLASHYTVNARPGGVPASNQVDTIALSENGGSNGNYESTVNIYMNATNGISNIHLTYTNGAVSWQEVRGNKVYNISLEKLSDVAGVCGDAIYTDSVDKPESNLCSVGAPTDPEETMVGEPRTLGWGWKCGETDCWAHMPTVTISCTDIINDTSAPQIRLTESYEVAGAWVDLRIQGWCSNDERFDIPDTFHVYTAGGSPLGIVLLNGAYCNGMGIRSVERVDVVGFSSNKDYNGYRLLAGDSCVYNGFTCSAGQYLPKNSTICSECPCGYYCPGGSWLKSTTTDQGKYECGEGKWSNARATSASNCGNISCGYYGTNACSATPSDQKCASGKYSTEGSSSCSSCPTGQQPSSNQCGCETIPETKYSCNPGQYLKKNSTTCSQCPCGYYCPGGDFFKSTTTDQGIYECGAGKWSSAGATSSNSCGNINCGYYGTNACSATPSDQKCASGRYSTVGSSSCSSCPSGQQPNSNQCSCETIPETKYSCNPGQYLKKNSTTCSQCPCGYYCPGGDFFKSTTTDQGIYECGAGKWSSAGATSSNSCGNISCGYYGTNACSATPSGQTCTSTNISYSTAGSSSCSSCQNPNVANATHCGCRPSSYGSCDLSEPYGCGEDNTVNKVDTTSSTEWEWYCKGEDDTGNGAYCHKGCPEGKTLKWNSTHNGECVDSNNPIRVRFKVVNNGSIFRFTSVEFDEFPSCRRPQNTASDINEELDHGDTYLGDYYTCDYFNTNQNYRVKLMGRPDYYNSAVTEYADAEFSLNDGDNTITLTVDGVSGVKCPKRGACPESIPGYDCNAYPLSSVYCPGSCVKKTYTCQANGEWNEDPTGSSAGCTPQPSGSCNTTTYPLTSTGVDHATSYSNCYSYTVVADSCVKQNRYRVTACDSGWTPSSDGRTCVSVNCKSPCRNRTIPNGSQETCYSDDEPRCREEGNVCDDVKETATCINGSRNKPNFENYEYYTCAGRSSLDKYYVRNGSTCVINAWVGGSSPIGEKDFLASNVTDGIIIHYYSDSYGYCKRDIFDDDTRHYPTIDDICKEYQGNISLDNGQSCWIYEECTRQGGAYVCSNTHSLWCIWHE